LRGREKQEGQDDCDAAGKQRGPGPAVFGKDLDAGRYDCGCQKEKPNYAEKRIKHVLTLGSGSSVPRIAFSWARNQDRAQTTSALPSG
jgi:hypothetical protein